MQSKCRNKPQWNGRLILSLQVRGEVVDLSKHAGPASSTDLGVHTANDAVITLPSLCLLKFSFLFLKIIFSVEPSSDSPISH